MSVYDTIKEGLQDDWRKARAYDDVRDLLEKVYRKKYSELGYTLQGEILNCLNSTPATKSGGVQPEFEE